MSHRMRRSRQPAFPDREVVAKAQGRFAKADKQHAGMEANPKREVAREQQRAKRVRNLKGAN